MKDKPGTLETDLKELMRHIRAISDLEQRINDEWGVTLRTSYISAKNSGWLNKADVWVNRGLEAIEEALGEKAKTSNFSRYTRVLRHYGVEFRQTADYKTKVFLKAWKDPPKVQIVEDGE